MEIVRQFCLSLTKVIIGVLLIVISLHYGLWPVNKIRTFIESSDREGRWGLHERTKKLNDVTFVHAANVVSL
jgi:hypothetical protein